MNTTSFQLLQLFLFMLFTTIQSQSGHCLPIYGQDDRHDIYEVEPRIRELARSTVALFQKKDVKIDGSSVMLQTTVYGKTFNLIPTERFYDQPMGSFCSGSLVESDIVLTSAHCFTSKKCKNTFFIFDYAITEKGHDAAKIPNSSVYRCEKILYKKLTKIKTNNDRFQRQLNGKHQDWAFVQLDRAVTDRKPLRLNIGDRAPAGTPIFTIGYPIGLPAKMADHATIIYNFPQDEFTSYLDLFAGTSGSPIFNATTLLIEGIATAGTYDYERATNDNPPKIKSRILPEEAYGVTSIQIKKILQDVKSNSGKSSLSRLFENRP